MSWLIFVAHLLHSAEPWILSPLIGLITNGGCCFPRSYVLVLPDSVATYNFPFHGQYLYNTGMKIGV